jgi:DNA-binding transcriptional LysR family regulator
MALTNLDLDALRSLVMGLDLGTFARAAERLGRSTSAISAQLKKLEEQTGCQIFQKSGRGLVLTDSGETLAAYARRLLELNDEAVSAVRGAKLEGWVRLGLQEDFGAAVLPHALGNFARAHPNVRIEGRIARNSDLLERVAAGQLDLALAWESGALDGLSERLAEVPLCWIGPANERLPLFSSSQPLPLTALEAPCLLRRIGCDQLDRAGIPWRLAFETPSLGGLWAATAAGLGVALRTPIGLPADLRILNPQYHGLPPLPSLGLILHQSKSGSSPLGEALAAIVRQAVYDVMKNDWISRR